jgi:hypothetical protein
MFTLNVCGAIVCVLKHSLNICIQRNYNIPYEMYFADRVGTPCCNVPRSNSQTL